MPLERYEHYRSIFMLGIACSIVLSVIVWGLPG